MNKRAIIFLVIGIILITGIYSFAKSQKEYIQESPLVLEKIFEFNIRDGKIISGYTEMKVTQGDEITFLITSNIAEQLHVHGYELKFEIEKDTPARISFTADTTGKFDLELHSSETGLGALEVLPK